MMNEFNPDGKDIRFIDSHYRDLFRIPDGGTIQVHYSDDSVVIKPCKFIDEYHTQIGNNVFHICQFAELLERNGSYCQAEPEIMGDAYNKNIEYYVFYAEYLLIGFERKSGAC